MYSGSHLVEQGVRGYLYRALDHCHGNRVGIYNYVFNILVFVIFVVVFGLSMWYAYRNKMTPYDQYKQQIRDQEYVLSKIRYFQTQKDLQREQLSAITQLPVLSQDELRNRGFGTVA